MTDVSEYEEKLRSLVQGEAQYFFERLEDIKTQVALSHGECTTELSRLPHDICLHTDPNTWDGLIASDSGVAGDANVCVSGMSVMLPRSYDFFAVTTDLF
jgi:hypothetical protein